MKFNQCLFRYWATWQSQQGGQNLN